MNTCRSGCIGALTLVSASRQDPFATNVTISRTAFADNHADATGDDIEIWRDGDNQGAVPCPAPGKACPGPWHDGTTRCCIDGDGTWNLTLPST